MLLFLTAALIAAKADQVVYDDALENGWQNWGWATLDYANASPVHSGSDSISVTFSSAWQGMQVWHADMDSTPYAAISFWLNGGPSGGQQLQVYGFLDAGGSPSQWQSSSYQIGPLPANAWQQVIIPLTALGVADEPNFTGFVIQDSTGAAQPTFYVDDISLIASTNYSLPPQIFGVYRQLWLNLNSSFGGSLAALTNTVNNPNWPNNPAAAYSQVFTNFETGLNTGLNNYGQRLRTFVVPPMNGYYTFWIASDDNSLLLLSSNENPANEAPIASVAS